MKKSNFYLLYGDDKALINNEINSLKRSLNIESQTIYFGIESVSDIVVECSTIGMFDLYKFIVIDCDYYFSSKKGMDILELENYFDSYNSNSYLIFVYNGSSIDSRSKLVKLIKNKGIIKKMEITNEYLSDFTKNYVSDREYMISSIDVGYFLNRCGNNIDNIVNELDKLMLYNFESRVITRDSISLLVDENINDTVFSLVNAILKNDSNRAMKLYYNFVDNGMDISQIVAVIANQIRLLFQVKRLYNSGKSNEDIAKILEFKSVYRVKYLLSDAYLYSESDLIGYLASLSDIDKAIKMGNADGRALLELFIVKKDM